MPYIITVLPRIKTAVPSVERFTVVEAETPEFAMLMFSRMYPTTTEKDYHVSCTSFSKEGLPPDPEKMNDARALRAMRALSFYRGDNKEDLVVILGDMLCDINHWCDRGGISFDSALDRGLLCYKQETDASDVVK